MKLITLPPICPFGATDAEHFGYVTRDGASFRIWSLTPDHSWFLRVFVENDGYVSYLIADRVGIEEEISPLLPLITGGDFQKAHQNLRRWRLPKGGLGVLH